jgi:hypothetical protein
MISGPTSYHIEGRVGCYMRQFRTIQVEYGQLSLQILDSFLKS